MGLEIMDNLSANHPMMDIEEFLLPDGSQILESSREEMLSRCRTSRAKSVKKIITKNIEAPKYIATQRRLFAKPWAAQRTQRSELVRWTLRCL